MKSTPIPWAYNGQTKTIYSRNPFPFEEGHSSNRWMNICTMESKLNYRTGEYSNQANIDADYIVNAVNSHGELISTCKSAAALLESKQADPESKRVYDEINSILVKAGELAIDTQISEKLLR